MQYLNNRCSWRFSILAYKSFQKHCILKASYDVVELDSWEHLEDGAAKPPIVAIRNQKWPKLNWPNTTMMNRLEHSMNFNIGRYIQLKSEKIKRSMHVLSKPSSN